MGVYVIPTRTNLPAYTMQVALDGAQYQFRFLFNETTGRWSMDIGLPDGTVFVAGVQLLLGVLLLNRFKDSRLPPGQFLLIDSTGEGREAGYNELGPVNSGGRVQLLYADAAQVESLGQ